MNKYKIELVGLKDCSNFVANFVSSGKSADLFNGDSYRVSAKSLLGAIAAVEWDDLYVVSDEDIYNEVKQWIVS